RRIKHTCAKHPRYNPERNGQAGIVGGCPVCSQMFSLYRAKLSVESAIRDFESQATCLSQEGQRNSIAAT
ncbi:hypothetical protein B1A_11935, partial [mine drainage metagenome]